MKKLTKILVPAACLIVAIASFGVTYAYLTATDSVVNEFKVGENEIEIVEEFKPPEKLEPGMSFDKMPSVKNTGGLPCFVRIRADFSDSEAEDFCILRYVYKENNEEKTLEPYNTFNWIKDDGDGYYYYKGILEPGKETEPLFTEVFIKKDTKLAMIDFDIIIYAESRQATEADKEACKNDSDYYKTVWEGK